MYLNPCRFSQFSPKSPPQNKNKKKKKSVSVNFSHTLFSLLPAHTNFLMQAVVWL